MNTRVAERYQDADAPEEEYAEPANRFADLYSALQCMLDDCGFDVPEDIQTSFLWEVQ